MRTVNFALVVGLIGFFSAQTSKAQQSGTNAQIWFQEGSGSDARWSDPYEALPTDQARCIITNNVYKDYKWLGCSLESLIWLSNYASEGSCQPLVTPVNFAGDNFIEHVQGVVTAFQSSSLNNALYTSSNVGTMWLGSFWHLMSRIWVDWLGAQPAGLDYSWKGANNTYYLQEQGSIANWAYDFCTDYPKEKGDSCFPITRYGFRVPCQNPSAPKQCVKIFEVWACGCKYFFPKNPSCLACQQN